MLKTQSESLNAQVADLNEKLLNRHVKSIAFLAQVIWSLTQKLLLLKIVKSSFFSLLYIFKAV